MSQILRRFARHLRTLVSRERSPRLRHKRRRICPEVIPLEERILLSVTSTPDQVLPAGTTPIAVAIARIDADTAPDMAILGSDGRVTVALNNLNDHWHTVRTIDLGAGAAHGMALAPFDPDPFADLVLQGPNGFTLARGDGMGGFTVVQTLTPGPAGAFAPSGGGRVGLAADFLDALDMLPDLAAVAPGTDEVLVFRGRGGNFATPVRYPSGADLPIEVVAGDFVGGPAPDLAVGHRDGTVTFLEGRGDGTFLPRPERSVGGLGTIAGLVAEDLDGDGDLDLAVSGSSGVIVLTNPNDVLASSPIANGDFGSGLTGWTSEGPVNAVSGFAQFLEGDVFLTSLRQTFVVPPNPQTVSFDLLSTSLEIAGGVPDAFEVSLLDAANNSLVPTFRPEATAFFNLNPGGAIGRATGVTFDGSRVTLDISGLTPGTSATLVFDLVGNPPGTASVVTIDNVQIAPETIASETFTATTLAGPFGSPAGITAADVNGDGNPDLVVADGGLGKLLVCNGDGSGGFTRSEVDVSSYGTGALAVAAGQLTSADTTADIVLTLSGSGIALTPLVHDATPPQVTFLDPAPNALLGVPVSQIRIRFSEAMNDAGPTANHSVTNPASYRLFTDSTNNIFENGAGDDVVIPIASVSYDPVTLEAILAIDPAFAPLADEKYRVVVEGDHADRALWDLARNRLGAGADALSTFTVDRTPPAVTLTLTPGVLLWPPNHVMVDITANLTISDPNAPTPRVVLLSVTSNEPDEGLGDGDFPDDIQGELIGTDDRHFRVRRERTAQGPPRIYTATYWVQDDACNGRVISASVVVVKSQGEGQTLLAQIGDPTPLGLGYLQGCNPPTQITTASFNLNQVVSNSIAAPGEVDVWTVDVAAGQRVFFDAQTGAGSTFAWSLTAPDGSRVFGGDFRDNGPIALSAAGRYALTVEHRAGQTGAYQFVAWAVPDTATVPITLGETVGGTIAVPGEQDRYSFTGAAGQRLFFDVQDTAGGALAFTLLGPGGALFSTATDDQGAFTLPAAGTYTVVVGPASVSDATGNYQFRVLGVPTDAPQTVAFGQTLTGSLTVPGATQTYEFRANIGQTILLDVLSNGATAGFTLLDPLGEVVFSGQAGDQTVLSLPASGTYTLVVDAPGETTGSFSFRLVDQTVPPPVTTTAGPAADSTLPNPTPSGRPLPSIDFGALRDITAFGQLSYAGTTFNRKTETLHATVRLTNVGPDPMGILVVMAIDGFTPPAAYLANPDTTHPTDLRPLIVYTTADLGADGLRPGETSAAVALRFGNPDQVRFGFGATLLAPGNRAPTFASTPTTDVRVGEPYAYDASADDPDGDLLTFRLLSGPVGMTVDPVSGLVQWTPTPDQAGSQSVLLAVEDGRGGTDTQTFTLRFPVTAPVPANAPPVIVSTPPGVPLVSGQAFAYDVHAIDPDGDTVRYLLGEGPAGMTIDPATGLLNWTATGGLNQWASSVLGFSSQLSTGNGSAAQATGAPNTFFYGDSSTAWAPALANGAAQFITLGYATPVHASGVTVRETFGNGFVTQIDLLDTDNALHTVWTGTDPSLPGSPVDFQVTFPVTPYLVKGVRVHVNTNHSTGREEIDAVRLHGADLVETVVVAEDGRGGFDTQTFVLTVTQSDTPLGSISGTLFDDADGNRVRDAGEGPLAGWTVYLDTDGDGVRDRIEPATITAADGSYRFDGLPAGQYTVREVLKPGWLQTAPGGEGGSPGGTVHYVDWTSANVSAGTASGVINLPGGSTVTVGFQAINPDGSPGNLLGAQVNGGTDYWNPSTPYVSAEVPNRPPGTDILRLVGGVNQTYRVTLSEPILDPIMAVLSLGQLSLPTTYNFDAPFTIVSSGTGFFGGNVNTLQQLPGNVLRGNEGHGTLKFLGTFDTFSWTVPTPENWHGFTFAVRTSASLAHDGFYVVDLAPGEAETAKDFGNKTDPNPPANTPPEFTSDGTPDATVNEPYVYRAEALDLDGDTLTFALGEHPDGMVIDPTTGVVAWVPSANQSGPRTVTVNVTDGRGGSDSQTFTVNVASGPLNHGPLIVTMPVTGARPGTAYAYPVEALDPEDDPVSYVLTDAPAGMGIDVTTGLITWTPTAEQFGEHTVTVRVTDGRGGFDVQTYTVTVTNTAPVEIHGTKYYDRNGNGTKDGDLGFLLVSSSDGNSVLRYDAATGLFAGAFVPAGSGGLVSPHGLAYGPDGNLYVGSAGTNSVLRYDGQTGAFLNVFAFGGGLQSTHGITFGPDGNLYVAGWGSDNVIRYDGRTGALMGVFASHSSLDGPTQLAFGPGGDLYVGGFFSDNVVRFDGVTGAFEGVFVPAGSGGLNGADGIVFGDDGDLYVSSRFTSNVLRYNGSTGAFKSVFASGNGLGEPFSLTFGLDGDLYVNSRGNNSVLHYDGTTGAFEGTFATGGLNRPTYLLFTRQASSGPHGPGIQPFRTVFNTDYVSAGLGGMRGFSGVTNLTVGGVTGTITRAYLYWHGPTNSTSLTANAAVTFAGTPIVGTQLGLSSDNCWGFQNSQAYRADVTSLVTGNGTYALTNFRKTNVEMNGVSLLVFFDDGDDTNNKDVVLFDGNDSNVTNAFDSNGWNVILPGINYESGTARVDMHVSDGQFFFDGAMVLNGSTLAPGGSIFQGSTVPRASGGGEGSLWDIKSFDVTSYLQPGSNTLRLTSSHQSGWDCLSLVVAAVVLPAGAAPEAPLSGWTVYLDNNRNNARDDGEPFSVTDALGNYSFTGLPAGTYVVAEELQPDWVQVSPDPERVHTLTLPAGAVATGIDFGNRLAADAGANRLPVFTSGPVTSASAGQLYAYHATAHDPDGDALTFTLAGGPRGMVVHPTSGLVVWVPDATQAGSHHVTLQVRDARGAISLQEYDINVVGIGSTLSITSTPPLLASVDSAYTYPVTTAPAELDASFEFLSAPDGMTIDEDTGLIAWTPEDGQEGIHLIIIRASDPQGGVAFQTYVLAVRPPNRAPTINSSPVTAIDAGTDYRYPVLAFDPDGDALTYELLDPPDGMTIDPRTGNLTWQTDLGDIGPHAIQVRVTDERGLSATQGYTLTVSADTEAPVVVILQTTNVTNAGTEVTFQVLATDNVAVVARTLTIDGVPLTLEPDGTVTVTAATPGLKRLAATATDPSGNVGTAEAILRVFDPNDNAGPVVQITNPLWGDVITNLTTVIGTASDDNLEYYRLEYAPIGTNQFVLFAEGTSSVVNGALGVLDPTLLSNSEYTIRLTAQDVNGRISITQLNIAVEAGTKVGNFQTGATDISIPLPGGLSLDIRRQYDTLNADTSGDLGFGWQICALEPNIRETVPRNPHENLLGMFVAFPFMAGDKVYLTNPDCERIGFTFSPVPTTGIFSLLNSTFGTIYEPRWIPDAGVEDQLYGEWDRVVIGPGFTGGFDAENGYRLPLLRLPDGSFVLAYLNVQYNPLGYRLVRKDGTIWHYSQFDGLVDVTDRNGNTLTVNNDGISSSTGPALTFERDAQGRIKRIIDPADNAITYTYNNRGELEAVHDAEGMLRSHYEYEGGPAHYISDVNSVRDSCGCTPSESQPVRVEYNLANQLSALVDALGHTTRYQYDLEGNTERVTDPLGNVITVEYDDRGNVVRQVSPLGAQVLMTYDANDNVTSITDERGSVIRMTYDARSNLTSLTDQMGNPYTVTYDALNNVTSQTDALGNVHQYRYDARGRLIEVLAPLGTTMGVEYDAQGRVVAVIDAYGNRSRLEYAGGANPTRLIHPDGTSQQMTYNGLGQLTTRTDENGGVTTFHYDASGKLLAVEDPLGQVTTLSYEGQNLVGVLNKRGHSTGYAYDAAGRVVAVTDAQGGVIRYTYDANGAMLTRTDQLGRTTTYAYRADRRVESVTDPLGGVTRYDYDAAGNVTAVTDANGHTTTMTYDARNTLLSRTDPLGHAWTYAYDDLGNQTSLTDPNGHTTAYEYDALLRITRVLDALEGSTALAYDLNGNLRSVTDAAGHTTSFEYDSQNRLTRQVDALGGVRQQTYDGVGNRISATDERGWTTAFAYDDLNRLTSTTDPSGATWTYQYNAANLPTVITDPLGHTTEFGYDSLDRLRTQTDAAGGVWSFDYDRVGNRTRVVDPIGRTTQFGYDALYRPTTTTDTSGAVSTQGYDAVGNRTSVTDPLGNVTRFVYDAANRQTSWTNPLNHSASFAYDAAGNLVQSTDPNGRVRVFTYDALNRLTDETWSAASPSSYAAHYTYDAVGNLLQASDPVSRYVFTYDVLNRLTGSDNAGSPGMPHVVLTYGYDAAGNQVSAEDDSGVRVASTYDRRNLLQSRTWAGGSIDPARVDFAYDARGDRTQTQRFADVAGTQQIGSSTFEYDARRRLTGITHHDPLGAVLADYDYTLDLADQLLRWTHHGRTVDYTHDPTGQLTGATEAGQTTEAYAYDTNGNRTGSGVALGPGNQILSDGTYGYTYDDAGNRVRRTLLATGEYTDYAYDNRNRLIRATTYSAGGVILTEAEYTYDVFDRRIARSVDADGAGPAAAQTVRTVYDGEHAWADYDAAGAVLARYLFGDGTDEIMARWRPGEGTAWYLTDHAGTVRDLVNAAGQLIDHLDYDSFGNILLQTAPAFGDRFTFTGREFDAETGLYYYRARAYDPRLGRFLSQDPIGFDAGDLNLYRYVTNNPLGATDPSGKLALMEWTIMTTAGALITIGCTYGELAAKDQLNDPEAIVEAGIRAFVGAAGGMLFGGGLAYMATARALALKITSSVLAMTVGGIGIGFTLYSVYDAWSVASQAQAKGQNADVYWRVFWVRFACAVADLGLLAISAWRFAANQMRRFKPGGSPDPAEVNRLLVDTAGNGKPKPNEAALAVELQGKLGTMDRAPKGSQVDFEITAGVNKGKKVDVLYTLEAKANPAKFNEQLQKNWPATEAQIRDHLNKADFVPLDFRSLDATNRGLILAFLNTLTKSLRDKIIIIH